MPTFLEVLYNAPCLLYTNQLSNRDRICDSRIAFRSPSRGKRRNRRKRRTTFSPAEHGAGRNMLGACTRCLATSTKAHERALFLWFFVFAIANILRKHRSPARHGLSPTRGSLSARSFAFRAANLTELRPRNCSEFL